MVPRTLVVDLVTPLEITQFMFLDEGIMNLRNNNNKARNLNLYCKEKIVKNMFFKLTIAKSL